MFYNKFFIGFLAVALMIAIAVMLNMGLNTDKRKSCCWIKYRGWSASPNKFQFWN